VDDQGYPLTDPNGDPLPPVEDLSDDGVDPNSDNGSGGYDDPTPIQITKYIPPVAPRPTAVESESGVRPAPAPRVVGADLIALVDRSHPIGLDGSGIDSGTRNFGSDERDAKVKPVEPMIGMTPDGDWMNDNDWYYDSELNQYIHLTVTDQWERIEAQYGNGRSDDVVAYADGRPFALDHVNADQAERVREIFRGHDDASADARDPSSHHANLDTRIDRAGSDTRSDVASAKDELKADAVLEASLNAFDAEEGEEVFSNAWAGHLQAQLAAQDGLLATHLQLNKFIEQDEKE